MRARDPTIAATSSVRQRKHDDVRQTRARATIRRGCDVRAASGWSCSDRRAAPADRPSARLSPRLTEWTTWPRYFPAKHSHSFERSSATTTATGSGVAKPQYEQHVRGPMIGLLERLAGDLPRFAPELISDPRVSLYRIYRDTRFSEDKTPLKTHVAAHFPARGFPRGEGSGLYVEVAPTWVWIGGGLYMPAVVGPAADSRAHRRTTTARSTVSSRARRSRAPSARSTASSSRACRAATSRTIRRPITSATSSFSPAVNSRRSSRPRRASIRSCCESSAPSRRWSASSTRRCSRRACVTRHRRAGRQQRLRQVARRTARRPQACSVEMVTRMPGRGSDPEALDRPPPPSRVPPAPGRRAPRRAPESRR